MKVRARRTVAAVLTAGLLTTVSACSSNSDDKDASSKKTISATKRPELSAGTSRKDVERNTPYYNDPNKVVQVVTFTDGTGDYSVSVNYKGQALVLDIKPTAKTEGTVTGATLVSPENKRSWCALDVSPCTYRTPMTWTSLVPQDITGTSTVYNPYSMAGLLSKGVKKTPDGSSFVLERDTFTARFFLDKRGDMTGLRLLEIDKNFHLKITLKDGKPIDCIGSYCQVWTMDGKKSTRVGKCYDNMDCRFDKPLRWTTLHGSDAFGVENNLFTRASLGLTD